MCCGLLISAACPTLQPALALPTKQGRSPVDTRSWQSASSSFCSPCGICCSSPNICLSLPEVCTGRSLLGHTGARQQFGLRTKAAFSWPPLRGRAGLGEGDQLDWSNFAAGIAERVCLAARHASRPAVVAQGARRCVRPRSPPVAAPNAAVSLSLVQRQGGIALGRSSSCDGALAVKLAKPFLAATNKCLATSSKSRTRQQATKQRNRQ
jgi:hypothetical protein